MISPKFSLTGIAIVASKDQPAYVRYGVRELAASLRAVTGRKVAIAETPIPGAAVQIIVGEKPVQRFAPQIWRKQSPAWGGEGFLISSTGRSLVVTGATPQGTKFGLVDLLKRLHATGQLPHHIDLTSAPAFAVRGMHLNGWAFRYPYTFRCWKEADWRRYIDLLTYQGANLLLLWPFMEIMPVPLSREDESYLREVQRVVDYAQTQRGMKVWIMQSANRVARGDCGVRDPRQRPYWVMNAAGQVDLNPADPRQFKRIMRSREVLYRLVNNAAGYVTIDSDPGGWPRSPIRDYLKIFQASREVLDRTNIHGRNAPLINWLWSGWGWQYDSRRDNAESVRDTIRNTIRAMKRETPEPWGLIAGKREFLPLCQAEGVLSKTVYVPYNVIEGEPSRPGTQLAFPLLRDHLDDLVRYPNLAGVMGNVQTPLLQFPHVGHFLASAWNLAARRRQPETVLRELAAQIYPEQQDLLANAWMALAPRARGSAGSLSQRLKRNRLGRPGVLGRKLFPDHRQIACDLVWQLDVAATFEALRQAATSRQDKKTCAARLEKFFDAAFTGDARHGWSDYWRQLGRPWDVAPCHERGYQQIIAGLRKKLCDDKAVSSFLEPMRRRLVRQHGAWIVTHCGIEPLRQALLKPKTQ